MFKLFGYIILIGIVFALVIPEVDSVEKNEVVKNTQTKDFKPKISKKLLQEISKKEAKILKEVRREPKVLAAMWDKNRDTFPVLSVAVLNNNSNRDGYAQYICLIVHKHKLTLKKYGFPFVKVEITDAKKALNSADFTPIGEAICKIQDK